MFFDKGAAFDTVYHELGHHAISKMTSTQRVNIQEAIEEMQPGLGMTVHETRSGFEEFISGLFRIAYTNKPSNSDATNYALQVLKKYGIWALVPPLTFIDNKKKKK